MDRGVKQIGIARRINADSVPICLSAFVIDIRQIATTGESRIFDGNYRFRNEETCKTNATIERPTANAGNTIRDVNALQIDATVESFTADAGYAIGNTHTGQTVAIVKCPRANAVNAIWDSYAAKAAATIKNTYTDALYPIAD